MDMKMGNVCRMMRKANKKAEHMWHRLTNKVEDKLDL